MIASQEKTKTENPMGSHSYWSVLTCCDPDRSGEYRSQSVGGAAVVGCAVDVSPIAVAPATREDEREQVIAFGNQPWESRSSAEGTRARKRKGHPALRGGAVATLREGRDHLGQRGLL